MMPLDGSSFSSEIVNIVRKWPWCVHYTPALPTAAPGGCSWPRLSVVTISGWQDADIGATALSVERQAYPDVEHIIEVRREHEDKRTALARALEKVTGR